MKTHSPSASDITRKWHLLDAKGEVLGRLATKIAGLLMGKGKTDFVRFMDIADHVVVINAADIVVTGRKETQKRYFRHSGYPGGLHVTELATQRAVHPDRIITHAVSGMIPQNKLHDRMLSHLHVFVGSQHSYTKQFKQPVEPINSKITE
jgi:large subunit ribosomal protein L13